MGGLKPGDRYNPAWYEGPLWDLYTTECKRVKALLGSAETFIHEKKHGWELGQEEQVEE